MAVDFVWLVDQSRSMIEEHRLLANITNILDQSFQSVALNHGVLPTENSNRFGLVGFAGEEDDQAKGVPILMADQSFFGNASELSLATQRLETGGSMEDGYHAALVALTQYPFRPSAVCHLLLVTDEGRSKLSPLLEFNTIKEAIIASNCSLHVLVNEEFDGNALGMSYTRDAYFDQGNGTYRLVPGVGRAFPQSGHSDTHQAYVELALSTRGSAWNLKRLRNGDASVEAFSRALSSFTTKSTFTALCDTCSCQFDGEFVCTPCTV